MQLIETSKDIGPKGLKLNYQVPRVAEGKPITALAKTEQFKFSGWEKTRFKIGKPSNNDDSLSTLLLFGPWLSSHTQKCSIIKLGTGQAG